MYAVFEDRNGRKMASDWLNCKNRPIGTRGEFLTLLSYLSLPQPRKKQKQQARGLFFFRFSTLLVHGRLLREDMCSRAL